MARLVDEEQIVSVVKILGFEIFCLEFELDFVVAYDTNFHFALAEIEGHLRAGPRASLTVSGDWDIAGGSIMVPSHVNRFVSSALTSMVAVNAKIADNKIPARNIRPLFGCKVSAHGTCARF